VLALEAYQHDNPRHYTLCELAAFRQAIDESLSKLAAALRAAQPAATLPDLRAALHQLKCAVKADKQAQAEPEGQNQWRFVLEQARRMVQYIQAMQQLLATAVARQSI